MSADPVQPGSDDGRSKRGPQRPVRNPPSIPHHTLIRRIGIGSYGEVWLAQNSMGTFRAVKIVYRDSFQDQKPFDRELWGIRKFEPISRTHEGFIDILQVGMDEAAGYFFYVMELGDDVEAKPALNPQTYSPKTLTTEIKLHGRLPIDGCLQLGAALAKAIHQLHCHGLAHRDIKPSNIIFVEGVPKLADIGMVAGFDDEKSYVGTEGFIPPEGPGTAQSDIYSLGKVLYEASTGQDRQKFPELPGPLLSAPDAAAFLELNEVILKACRNDLTERYKTAAEMHEDLVLLVDGRSVRRLRQLERNVLTAKRTLVAAVVIVAAAIIVSYPFYRNRKEQSELRQRDIGSAIAYGNRALESGDLTASLQYFTEVLRLHHESNLPDAEDRYRIGAVLAQCPKLTHLWNLGGSVYDIRISPDDKHIVASCAKGAYVVFDLDGDHETKRTVQTEEGHSADFSPDGKTIAVADRHGVKLLDLSSLRETGRLEGTEAIKAIRYSVDGSKLAVSQGNGCATIWDIHTAKKLFSLKHDSIVRYAGFSHNGKLIGTASNDGTAAIWDAQTGAVIARMKHPSWVGSIEFSPDDSEVVTACVDHYARVWDTNGVKRFPTIPMEDAATQASFSPDGRYILSASTDGSLKFSTAVNQTPIPVNHTLRLGDRLYCATFSHDGSQIVAGGNNGTVGVWSLAGVSCRPDRARSVPSEDGRRLISYSNGIVTVFDAKTRVPLAPPLKVESAPWSLQLNKDGHSAAVLCRVGVTSNFLVTFFEVIPNQKPPLEQNITEYPWAFSEDEDGRHVVVVSGQSYRIFDLSTGNVISNSIGATNYKSCLLDWADQKLITWSQESDYINVWSATNGMPCYPPIKLAAQVSDVHISADRTKLLTACMDSSIDSFYATEFSLGTGREVGEKMWHQDGVIDAIYNADGSKIATAGEDYFAATWSADKQHRRLMSIHHRGQVVSVDFNQAGNALLTCSRDKRVQVWSASTGDPLTPAFYFSPFFYYAKFVGDESRIIVLTDRGSFLWSVNSDERPATDLIDIAALLRGGTAEGDFEHLARDNTRFVTIWNRLRAQYPATFTTSLEELRAWHLFSADECSMAENWLGEAFHLGILVRDGETNLTPRLAAAHAKLESNK